MADHSTHTQKVPVRVNTEQIGVIRKDYAIIEQTNDQIASGVVVSYIERCLAKPHLDITSWAYVEPINREDTEKLNVVLTEGQWKRIDELCVLKHIGREQLIRWIIADTAVAAGYPRG